MHNAKIILIFTLLLVTYQLQLTQAMMQQGNIANPITIAQQTNPNPCTSPGNLTYQSSAGVNNRLRHIGKHLTAGNNKHTYFTNNTGIQNIPGIASLVDIVNFIDIIHKQFQIQNFNFNIPTQNPGTTMQHPITLNNMPYNVTVANDTNIGQCRITIKPANPTTAGYPIVGTNNAGDNLYSYKLAMDISTNNLPHIVNTFFPCK